MKEIQNNNIKCISPEGKEFFTCLHWLRSFIWMLKITWIEKEESIKTPIDKISAVVKTKEAKFPSKLVVDDNYMTRLKKALEEGTEITIRGWKFSVI